MNNSGYSETRCTRFKGEVIEVFEKIEVFVTLENLNNLNILTMQFDVSIYDKFRVKHVVNHLIVQT